MTSQEITQYQVLKDSAASFLRETWPGWSASHPKVLGTDPRIGEYISSVVEHPDAHGLYELLGVRHFLKLADKYVWRSGRARFFIQFYERLRFSGLTARQCYRLTPVQTFFFSAVYGLYDFNGHRLLRDVYLMVARKFSKTTQTAAMAVYEMLFGDDNAQCYIGANSYDQAKICFDEVSNIMDDVDPSGRMIKRNRQKIYFKTGKRHSFTQCLTSNARTKDGLNASLVIMDEYAQARNTLGTSGAALKNVLTSSMGARTQPLTMVITTASEVLDGPFAHELDGVKAVLRGEIENDRLFAMLFLPDLGDDESRPETWMKAQPHMGVTVSLEYYEQQWAQAQLSAENMMVFRTKLLNIFTVSERSAWISADKALSVSRPLKLEDLKGRPSAMCAIDLSESSDFSAVSVGLYMDKSFYFHTAYFFPEGALATHPNGELYRTWAEQGHLRLTPGEVIDYPTIVSYILGVNKYVSILNIGYDPWKSQEVVNMLAAAGAKNVLKPLRQTYGYFTAPVESFEHGIKTGRVFIDDNPINVFCFGNAVLDEDKLENKKPIKRSPNRKIDGLVTMLMAMRLFIDYEQ